MTATTFHAEMQASLRECRMVFERLMQVAGVEPGLVPSARDAALHAVADGLCRFDEIERHLDLIEPDATARPRLAEGPDGLLLDAGHCHAWLVAEAAVDLMVDMHRRGGTAALTLIHLVAVEQLGAARGFAEKHGFHTVLERGTEAIRLTLQPSPLARDATFDRIRREGLTVERALWMHLFHRANAALAPDSFASRRHAGALVVEADGRIIGRSDEDDTDLSLLGAGLTGNFAEASQS